MKINLATWDRIFRLIFGMLLVTWAVAGGPGWAYFGVYLIFSGAWGWCGFYSFFKIRSAHFEERKMIPAEEDDAP
jgi:hypothetical protein